MRSRFMSGICRIASSAVADSSLGNMLPHAEMDMIFAVPGLLPFLAECLYYEPCMACKYIAEVFRSKRSSMTWQELVWEYVRRPISFGILSDCIAVEEKSLFACVQCAIRTR